MLVRADYPGNVKRGDVCVFIGILTCENVCLTFTLKKMPYT